MITRNKKQETRNKSYNQSLIIINYNGGGVYF